MAFHFKVDFIGSVYVNQTFAFFLSTNVKTWTHTHTQTHTHTHNPGKSTSLTRLIMTYNNVKLNWSNWLILGYFLTIALFFMLSKCSGWTCRSTWAIFFNWVTLYQVKIAFLYIVSGWQFHTRSKCVLWFIVIYRKYMNYGLLLYFFYESQGWCR